MTDWQPIETAPEDGREALVGVWVCGPDHDPYWSSWVAFLDGGALGEDGAYGDTPTHFHNLPAPPTQDPTS